MHALSGRNRLVFMLPAVAVVLAAMVVACNRTTRQPEALVVVAGATEVRYTSYAGTNQVRYRVRERYPARTTLQAISNRLKSQGWKVLKEDFLNPGHPPGHVRGWGYFVDGTRKPEQEVKQWLAQWANAEGDIVEYVLRYCWPVGGPANTDSLQVYAIYIPADLARAQRARAGTLNPR